MAMTKTTVLTKNQAAELVSSFLNEFQTWCNQTHDPKPAQLEHFITSNFQLSSNGQIKVKNPNEYLSRIEKFRKRYSHIEFSDIFEEPLVNDNKIVIHYEVTLNARNGEKKQVYIMAIATVEDNKFSKWVQAAHEKGTGQWDS
jgi:hypothetical protein